MPSFLIFLARIEMFDIGGIFPLKTSRCRVVHGERFPEAQSIGEVVENRGVGRGVSMPMILVSLIILQGP